MHIFFSGIGGTAIGPLALLASQAGYTVSGSDKQDSQYIQYLRRRGLGNIHIGQDRAAIERAHQEQPIDWFVHSSAITMENPDSEELDFCREQGIKVSKRDELLNAILQDKKLKLVAIAGTHGKTTTTAMVIWLLKQMQLPVSYSVGAKIEFGDMGQYDKDSEYFVYECDEYDRNFLAFEPHLSLITGVSWDHHEIFPTREEYQQAFLEFIGQSQKTLLWREDADYLGLEPQSSLLVQDANNPHLHDIELPGHYNRLDAWLAVQALHELTGEPIETLLGLINDFPGLQRRMEMITKGLFSDYAHTPEKIRGGLSVARELADKHGQKLVIVYEPLTNRRQHYMIDDYKDCFEGADKVYWIPSYLAREVPGQPVLTPDEMIRHLSDPSLAEAAERDENLEKAIREHLENGDMVVGMAGGGGDSLDEWLRARFSPVD